MQPNQNEKKKSNALGCLLLIILMVVVGAGCNMIGNSSSSSTKSCGWDTNCDGRMSGNESQRQINDAAKRLQGYGK